MPHPKFPWQPRQFPSSEATSISVMKLLSAALAEIEKVPLASALVQRDRLETERAGEPHGTPHQQPAGFIVWGISVFGEGRIAQQNLFEFPPLGDLFLGGASRQPRDWATDLEVGFSGLSTIRLTLASLVSVGKSCRVLASCRSVDAGLEQQSFG